MRRVLLCFSFLLAAITVFAAKETTPAAYSYKTIGDTVVVEIDMYAEAKPSNFVFNSFSDAWATLKSVPNICSVTPAVAGDLTGDKTQLLKPVVMLMAEYPEGYTGSEVVGATGGEANNAKVIFFRNINTNGGKELVVRSKTKKGLKATLKHVVIRRSKNITFDYLNITGTSTNLADADNAIDIDNGAGLNNLENLEPNDWNFAEISSSTEESNIVIKNCNISSSSIVCIHVSAYDGVTFENNEIKADYDFVNANASQAEHAAHWGASARFINSKNITFVRNTIENNHATSVFLQGSKNVLIHNNVFWHNNAVNIQDNTVSVVRLISYEHKEDCKAFANYLNPVISGPAGVRAGVDGIKYMSTAVDGASYEWILPEGWRITSGENTSNITVSTPSGEGSGTIHVNITKNECTVSTFIDVKWKDGITVYCRRPHATREVDSDGDCHYKLWYEKSINPGPNYMKFGYVKENPDEVTDVDLYSYNGGKDYTVKDENEIAIKGTEAFTDAEGHVWDMFNVAEDFTDVYFRAPNDNPDVNLNGGMQFFGWACYSLSCHVETPIKEDLYFTIGPWEIYYRTDGTRTLRKGRVLYQVTSPRMANQIPSRFPLENIGIYYNTMFVKDSNSKNKFDFFRIGGNVQPTDGLEANFDVNTIKFAYNNCFSFDTDITGFNNHYNISELSNYHESTEPNKSHSYIKEYYLGSLLETNWYPSFIGNNFWSVNEGQLENNLYSVLDISEGKGDDNKFINVKDLLCNDNPTEPAMLIIGDADLNLGGDLEDVSGLLRDDMLSVDRLGKARPEYGKTVGAYQQGGELVKQIIWHGSTSAEWDNLNNWYKEDGSLINCMDEFSEKLMVIVPSQMSNEYKTPRSGISVYPTIPDIATQVNAGSSAKIADKIFIEYGGALLGVEKLNAENYNEAIVQFKARRSEWLLVGPVVKPWDVDDDGNIITREMVSGDFFVANQLPHVYMHEAYLDDENNTDWNESFAPLDVPLYENTVFAIRIPNQYGPKKHTASRYNRDNGTTFDPAEPITFNYVGRFINETALPKYKNMQASSPKLLTNTYPANIDAKKLAQGAGGSVQVYDYDKKSFRATKEGDVIIAQHGFVFTPSTDGDLQIKSDYIVTSSTMHRSAEQKIAYCDIRLSNKSASTASEIVISYDELKDDVANYAVDAPKIFNGKEKSLPDLYAIRYDKNWAGVVIPTVAEPIPLGVKVNANNQIFTFSLESTSADFDVLLEDRQKGEVYNLSAGETCEVSGLVVGVCEGRFYLMLSEKPDEETPEEGDDVTTEAEETDPIASGIDIFTQGSSVVVSCNSEMQLMQVVVSDVAGRHQMYNVSGQYVKLDLLVNTGVYTISVIGDKQTRVEKIKLN